MSKPAKPSPAVQGDAARALDAVAGRIKALPADRQEAFLTWLEREHEKATRPKRRPGRPRLFVALLTDSVTVKMTPAMRQEMQRIAEEHGLRNEAEYLRSLHQAYLAMSGLRRPKRTRK